MAVTEELSPNGSEAHHEESSQSVVEQIVLVKVMMHS